VTDRVSSRTQAAAWLVQGSEAAEREQRALDEGLIFIGEPGLGDVTGYTHDGIRLALKAAYPEYAENVISNWTDQLWRFTNQIAIGDYVVMPLHIKPGYVAIGRVTGHYEYKETEPAESRHIRAVQWVRKNVPRESLPPDVQASIIRDSALTDVWHGSLIL
jgi:restriction system protein